MVSKLDKEAAVELEIYAENTSEIYHRHTMPTIENLRRKYAKGTYDHEKAVKAWEYVAAHAAKMYCMEFATPQAWNTVFSAPTRREVARCLEQVYYREYIKQ